VGPQLWKQCRTGVAAMVWTCAELWAWEVQVFEASALGTGNAAAYTLLSSTYSLLITAFPVSIASAASALIGEALGRGEADRAVALLYAACVLALCSTSCYALPLGWARGALAALLSGGVAEVGTKFETALPLILAMHFLDGLFNVLKAWLTVRNKQAFGALMSLVIYYGVGVPLGYWLAWHLDWGLVGLWTGLGTSVLLGCVATAVQAACDIERSFAPNDAEGEYDLVYREFEESDAGGRGKSPHWLQQVRTLASASFRRLRLLGLVAPGLVIFTTCAVWVSPAHTTATMRLSSKLATQPTAGGLLDGAAPCLWSTGGDFYSYPFVAYFASSAGNYGWEVVIADQSKATEGTEAGRRLQTSGSPLWLSTRLSANRERLQTVEMRWLSTRLFATNERSLPVPRIQARMTGFGALRLGRSHDVYDEPYSEPLDPRIEVGWALWLRQPEVRWGADDDADEWTSRAFVGTRVSTATHTFCGCQSMRGDRKAFRLTEHGRAQIEFGSATPDQRDTAATWYLNLTRREINAQIEATCRPIAERTTCPSDNETAFGEWAARRDNGSYWVLPPWVEVYGSLPDAE